ncbi:MAG TPA: D-inositol-3-phosphate glycosyltransferase [Mycobacteriales bacterium]|nr:D-inositol-3-phosphate glycosyltransferase [Mycobacteriales bacterium]
MPRVSRIHPHRIATLSVHTSPLDQPGGGDAGGMNVYIVEVARQLAELGVEVEIFTRTTSGELPSKVELAPGVLVRHVTAGPFEGLSKDNLPCQMCAFTAGVLRAEARREPGWYDVIHSHYWLSGQVGGVARERWGVPLVHTAHTLAKVKNTQLADGDRPEPLARVIGEEQVVAEADRLTASTAAEAADLVDRYGADPARVEVIPPGVDLERFRLGSASTARTRLGIPPDAAVLLFVGRIQPLKAPDILLRAAAELAAGDPELRDRLRVLVVGAPSGTGLARPESLRRLAGELGIGGLLCFLPPMPAAELAEVYRAADLTVVPSYNESFGLVALESQACGTPVVAAAVGGLPTAVADGVSGRLVDGHRPSDYATAIGQLLREPAQREWLATGCRGHAERFSWRTTAERLLETYRDAMADPIFVSTGAARLAAQ